MCLPPRVVVEWGSETQLVSVVVQDVEVPLPPHCIRRRCCGGEACTNSIRVERIDILHEEDAAPPPVPTSVCRWAVCRVIEEVYVDVGVCCHRCNCTEG